LRSGDHPADLAQSTINEVVFHRRAYMGKNRSVERDRQDDGMCRRSERCHAGGSADPATTSHLPTSFAPIQNRITSLCERSDIHCVILVMSSKPEVDETALMNLIPASKDVDGLSAANLGALVQSAPD
jgi:hypothetical protein